MLPNYYCTFNNVAYFQIVNNLEVTGWVDTNTYNKLFVERNVVEPKATIVEILTDRDGMLMVHAIGNEETEKLAISVYNGNNFADYTTVDDRECWLWTETPNSGTYKVYATAYSANGTAKKSDVYNVEVSKYAVVEKVFEDLAEEQEIGYELQLGLIKALAENFVIRPANTLADAIDYVVSYPNTTLTQMRAEEREKIITSIDEYIENALPNGANYYYVGEMIGDIDSLAIDSYLIVDGITTIITSIKNLPSSLKIVKAQMAMAGGGYTTVEIVVPSGEAIAATAQGVATIGIAAISLSPREDWIDHDEAETTVDEKASSKKLAANMEAVGRERPRDYKTAAHHIVAGYSKKAEEARAILKKFGVSINDEANGVFLPTQKGLSNSAYHPSLHTKKYYDKVNEILGYAQTRDEVIAFLREIAEELLDNSF